MSRLSPPRARQPSHVVITGASSGLGAALAAQYAKRSLRLSLLGRNQKRLAQVQASVATQGCQVGTFACDVRSPEAMQEALIRIDDCQPVTLLIANAGMGGSAALSNATGEHPDIARDIVATNLLGVMNTIAPVLPRLLARRHGHIVIIGSIAGAAALPVAPAYCASKSAVRTYGTALRRSLSASGIDVTVVLPGFIETPMSASLRGRKPFLESAEQAASRIVRAVDTKRRELSFPWQLAWLVRLNDWLPATITDEATSYVLSRWSIR